MVAASFTTLARSRHGCSAGRCSARSSLWLGIGLHAGWVFCVQGLAKFAGVRAGECCPWIGRGHPRRPRAARHRHPHRRALPRLALTWATRPITRRLFRALGTLCFPPHCAACKVGDRAGHPPLRFACAETVQPHRGAVLPALFAAVRRRDHAAVHLLELRGSRSPLRMRRRRVSAATASSAISSTRSNTTASFTSAVRSPDWLAAMRSKTRALPRARSTRFVPVPLHHVRFREREFNQAAELADTRLAALRDSRPARAEAHALHLHADEARSRRANGKLARRLPRAPHLRA